MSLLPKKLRFWLFDTLSLKMMRYVDVVPRHKAKGLDSHKNQAEVISEINGGAAKPFYGSTKL